LKLTFDSRLSNFALNFNLRHYYVVYQWADGGEQCIQKYECVHQGPVHDLFVTEDYIITVGRCKLKPVSRLTVWSVRSTMVDWVCQCTTCERLGPG